VQQRLHILKSKLTVPKISSTLRRPGLIERVKEISHKKLLLVIAGAGYGKTTIVAQSVAEIQIPVVWYCLDETDKDLTTFMSYLVAGIGEYQAGFGKELSKRLRTAASSQKGYDRILLELLKRLESQIDQDVIIVLDDYHQVEDSLEISDAMEFLLARIPNTFHFILMSRKNPRIRISRYRATLEIAEIGERDLSFNSDEIQCLYRDVLNIHVNDATVGRLLDRTYGWIAGLILFFNALQRKPSGRSHEELLDLEKSQRLMFHYLEENVFETQPWEIRHFMMKSSLLNRLDPAFCDRLFGGQRSAVILNTLWGSHLLTFSGGDTQESFQYHDLLREFLRTKLERDYDRSKIDMLHHRIARLMEEDGNIAGAMHHFLEARQFEVLCRIIADMAFKDLMDCPFRFFVDTFYKIPEELIYKDARLLHIEGRLASMRGEIQEAIDVFQRALGRFEEEGNSIGVANCLKDLGLHYYLTGDVVGAKAQMKALWGTAHDDPFFPSEIAGYLILFCSILGRMEEADEYYDAGRRRLFEAGRAQKALAYAYLDFCHAYRFHASGDFERADALNKKILEAFARIRMEPLLPLAYFQAALTAFFRLRSNEGYEYAKKGLSLAEEMNIYDAQYAWLLYAKALNGQDIVGHDRAMHDAVESMRVFERTGNPWGQGAVHDLLGALYQNGNDREQAEASLRAGLKVIEGLKLSVAEGALAVRLAELLFENGLTEEVELLLTGYDHAIGVSKFYVFRRQLLLARIETDGGSVEKALRAMEMALRIAQENHYGGWLARGPSCLVTILVECHCAGIMRPYIEKIFRMANRTVQDHLRILAKKRGKRVRRTVDDLIAVLPAHVAQPFKIRCLGKFEVSHGNERIKQDSWKHSKAAKLFKYLVLHRKRGFVTKESLLELVWPNEDVEKTNKRFHVALTTLRRILEPELKRGVASSYIVRQNDGYRLDIGEKGCIDFETFSKELDLAGEVKNRQPDQALTHYERAEKIYRGPLFEEDPYEEGFLEDREKLQEVYLHTLKQIVHLYEKEQDWQNCIRYARKYLLVDKYSEPVYCELMRFHYFNGERPKIIKTFEECELHITQDLDCPLSDETLTLYHSLTG